MGQWSARGPSLLGPGGARLCRPPSASGSPLAPVSVSAFASPSAFTLSLAAAKRANPAPDASRAEGRLRTRPLTAAGPHHRRPTRSRAAAARAARQTPQPIRRLAAARLYQVAPRGRNWQDKWLSLALHFGSPLSPLGRQLLTLIFIPAPKHWALSSLARSLASSPSPPDASPSLFGAR